MAIDSTIATSRRGYLSQDELEQMADITVTDTNEADDQISQAEEMIDAFVGFQEKFFNGEVTGRCSQTGATTYLYLTTDQKSVYQNDYFKGMEVEILGGTTEGQRRKITTSDYASGKITVDSAFTVAPTTTSFYKIYQLGKFPRHEDVKYYTDTEPYQYYKHIPEIVKRAVAAQVEYIIEMGSAFFSSDKSRKQSESISRYSYTNVSGESLSDKMISPKAKLILKGIRNRVGSF